MTRTDKGHRYPRTGENIISSLEHRTKSSVTDMTHTFASQPELEAFQLRKDFQELIEEANELFRDIVLVL